MGLFDLFKKKSTKNTDQRSNNGSSTNSFGQRMDRLTPEGELPYGWIYANNDFVKPTESDYRYISEEYYKAQNADVLKKYATLKSLVVYMEDIKNKCIAKGECFRKWSEIVVANPETLLQLKTELAHMEEHMDELLQHEKKLTQLRSDLIKMIQAEPGLKQEQLYKRFAPDMKGSISNELYLMAADGIIKREKNGRSYALYMK